MATNLVKFYSATQEKYDALGATVDANALYFITDTGKIYKGTNDVTTNVSFATKAPTAPLYSNKMVVVKEAEGIYSIYVGDTSGTPVKVSTGTVSTKEAFNDLAVNGGFVPTVAAVQGYVSSAITTATKGASDAYKDATFAAADGKLTFTPISGTAKDVTLTGVAHSVSYDAENLKLTISEYGKEDAIEVNIPKDMFVRDGEYVAEYNFGTEETPDNKPAILLTISVTDAKGNAAEKVVPIDVTGLVDVYTVSDTATIDLTMTDNNISGEIKVTAATADENDVAAKLMAYDATGKKIVSTKSLTDVMSDVDGKVSAAKTELQGKIDAIKTLSSGDANKVVISTADGIVRSSAVLGTASLATTPSADTLATEKAVSDAITTAVDTAITWNTL